jgi:hypothetical protein
MTMTVDSRLARLAPTIRVGWRVVGAVVAVGALGMGTAQAVSQIAHEEETIVQTFAAAGLTGIDLSNDDGSVRIVSHDADEIRVTALVSNGLVATDHDMRIEGDRLVIRSDCPFLLSDFCSVAYTIAMPADLSVRARNDDAGISVIGIDGSLDLATEDADIEVDGGRDTVRLHTEHGSIDATNVRAELTEATSEHGTVRLAFADDPRQVTARSEHGDVEIVVPDSRATYQVSLSSGHGRTELLVRTDPASARTISGRSEHGDVTVRY